MLLKSWGKAYNPLTTKRVKDFRCPDCQWDLLDCKTRREVCEKTNQSIVGFSSSSPAPSINNLSVGIVILECPKCSSLFWFHVTQEYVKSTAEICEKWPKD